jgi:carboxymethylenebutenolidase
MLAEIDQGRVARAEVTCANGMPAFLAQPETPGPHPVMVLLHERYGLQDHQRDLCTRFAADGFVAMAPNLFFREPDLEAIARAEARAEVSDEQVNGDIDVALDYLTANVPGADLSKVAVMGVCQTGRFPIAYSAVPGARIAAAVIFHGAAYKREWVLNAEKVIPYDDLIASSKVPVFGAFGEKDVLILHEDVLRFRRSLEGAKRSYEITIYGDAPHSWLNDRLPSWRQPQADAAWQALLAFLERVNGGGFPTDRVRWRFTADTAPSDDESSEATGQH